MVDFFTRIHNIKKSMSHYFSKLSPNKMTILLNIIIIIILLFTGNLMYETNDDIEMISILSGRYGNIAIPDAIFLSNILSYALYYCYQYFPIIPWYSVFLYTCQLIAYFLLNRIIIQLFEDGKSKIMMIISFMALYSYLFYRLNFASTSLFLWFAVSMYLLVLYVTQSSENIEKRQLFLLGVLLSISYLIRPSITTLAVLFSFPIFIVLITLEKYKKILYLILPLIFVILFNQLLYISTMQNNNNEEFQYYNKVRSDFVDTYKSKINEKTGEALENVGWNIEDYKVAQEWWLYDEEVFATEKINQFLEKNAHMLISVQGIGNLFKSPFVMLLCGSLLVYRCKTTAMNISSTQKNGNTWYSSEIYRCNSFTNSFISYN